MRASIPFAALLALGVIPSLAASQPIVVKSKPGNGHWEVSYLTTHDKTDPGTGTHAASLFCKTQAAAKAEAARIQRWDQQELAKPPVWFRVTKIYIEGDDTPAEQPPPKDAAPKTPTLLEKIEGAAEKVKDAKAKFDDAKWAAKFLADPKAALEEKIEGWEKKAQKDARKLGDTIKEYGENVAGAYNRAKNLKDDLLKLESDAMDKSFKKVNDAVAEYNKQANAGGQFFGSKVSPFPQMKPVGLDTVKAVSEWKSALKTQYQLEPWKEKLDKAKTSLDAERESLAAEWKELSTKGNPDPADPKVIRLRKRLTKYTTEVEKYSTALVDYTRQANQLSETATAFRDGNEEAVDHFKLTGTRWETPDNIFGLRYVTFLPGNKVMGQFNVEASRGEGKWKQTGPNTIAGDFGRFGTFTATVAGSKLNLTWGRGRPRVYTPSK